MGTIGTRAAQAKLAGLAGPVKAPMAFFTMEWEETDISSFYEESDFKQVQRCQRGKSSLCRSSLSSMSCSEFGVADRIPVLGSMLKGSGFSFSLRTFLHGQAPPAWLHTASVGQ